MLFVGCLMAAALRRESKKRKGLFLELTTLPPNCIAISPPSFPNIIKRCPPFPPSGCLTHLRYTMEKWAMKTNVPGFLAPAIHACDRQYNKRRGGGKGATCFLPPPPSFSFPPMLIFLTQSPPPPPDSEGAREAQMSLSRPLPNCCRRLLACSRL